MHHPGPALTRAERSRREIQRVEDESIMAWVHMLELREREAKGHSQRVAEGAVRFARRIGIAEARLVNIYRGGLLHDIGKIAIPSEILFKTGPLTEDEWQIVRQHPVTAYELLSQISYLRQALAIPYHHHEKWDGSGYPCGLRGETIPIEARLFAIIDVWDALSFDRCYRVAWPKEQLTDHMLSLSGTHFDPLLLAEFLRWQGEVKI